MTDTRRALVVVDVQSDFCEGGSLAVAGGAAVAGRISEFLRGRRDDYAAVIASRDWHLPHDDNGGHFAAEPDFADSWPAHCVSGTPGADYHPALDTAYVDAHVRKGHGRPAYSAFEASDDEGRLLADLLAAFDVRAVDVVGIATDYCVLQTALSAMERGLDVRVLHDLTVGVHPVTTRAALDSLSQRGAAVVAAVQG